MKKICPGCGEERDVDLDFSWKYKDRGIRNTRCRICQSQVSKQHYKNNKQSYVGRTRAREVLVTGENLPNIYLVIPVLIVVKPIFVCLILTM